MCIAGREIGHNKSRSPFKRSDQYCCRIVKPTIEKMRRAQSGTRISPQRTTRTQPQGCLKMLDPKIELTCEILKRAAPVPAASKAGIED